MNDGNEKTAGNLIMAIIIHIYIGWGLLFLTKLGINHLTNNAYMGLIPASVIILPFFWIVFDLARIFQGLSLTAIFSRILGPVCGKILGCYLWLYIAFYEIITMRDGLLMIHTYFFKRSPFLLLAVVFIASILYPALKGVNSIGRLAGFMLLPPILLIILLEVLGLANINLSNIRPVLAGSPWNWMLSGMDLTIILIPGTAIFFYMQNMSQWQSIKKMSLYAFGIVIPIFFLGLFGTVGIYGPSLTKKMSWSIVEFFHLIDYPYLLLEQAGLFFLIAWFASFFVAMSQGLFLIGNHYHIIFPRIKRNWLILVMSILALIIVNHPTTTIFIDSIMKSYQKWIAFSHLVILSGTWLIARLRFGKKEISG